MTEILKKIWVIDDDKSIKWVLKKALEKHNYQVQTFGNTNEAINHFNHDIPNLIISDIKMPGESGLHFLQKVKHKFPDIPIIIMTAFTDLDSAVDSYALGAFEYLPKPFNIGDAIKIVNSAFEEENKEFDITISTKNKIIGTSPAMQNVYKQIGKLGKSDASILITGESGTGKELVAQAIHENSKRSSFAFIAINSAAIPSELLESELFGYEKGAFSGATQDKKGYFEDADNGTLFLDEIADMPINLQSKLLRVLNDGSFQKLGSNKTLKTNVRIIAATHQDLGKNISNDSFREDLYHRLNVISIHLPPLRERDNDILLLANFFFKISANEINTQPKFLNDETIGYFKKLKWTGNIRQLRNICHWLTVMTPGREIGISDLPNEILKESISSFADQNWDSSLRSEIEGELLKNTPNLYSYFISKMETMLIESALKNNKDRKNQAAVALGIGRNTITRKMVELNIKNKG